MRIELLVITIIALIYSASAYINEDGVNIEVVEADASSNVLKQNPDNHDDHPNNQIHKKKRKHKKHRLHPPRVGHKVQVQNGAGNAPSRLVRQNVNRRVNIADNWERIPFIFQTYNEPDFNQYYLMPALSNGYIGTTVKNDSLYVMGLYNGLNGKSHRVKIPSLTAVEAYFPLYDENDIISYHFDTRRGIYTIQTRNNQAEILQRFYVHRRYRNLIVNEIRVELLARVSVIIELYNETQLNLNTAYVNSPMNPNGYSYYFQDQNPENVSYEQRVIKQPTRIDKRTELNDGCYYLQATIPQTEISNKRQKQIHTYYTNIPNRLTVYNNRTIQTFHIIQSVDSDNNRARGAYDDAIRMITQDPNSLYVQHVSAWEEIWQKAGMAAISEPSYSENNQETFKVAQRLYASFYNLYASLPLTFDNSFYGLSPCGLAYGSLRPEYFNNSNLQPTTNRPLSDGYGGHIMYNQELWMLPLIAMFNQDMSKSIINSRLRRGLNTDHMNMYEQARELAKQENLMGLRYPWEQGDYGVDVSPFADMRKSKIHVSADISFGIRSYLRVTHSREFLLQSMSSEVAVRGEEYINEIAKYWNDKFELDPMSNQYEIKMVSFGERSQTREVNNEAFTNYMASLAMDAYKYALEISDKNPYDPQFAVTVREYEEKIARVKIPYEQFRQLYLEYDGFTTSQLNEEAWAPLLNYPLQKMMTYSEKKVLYDSYATQLPNEGRNMPEYASYVVGYTELNDDVKARDYFNRMSTYFNGPFLVASEFLQQSSTLNPQNTFNYLPAYAAYATAFIAGYCGVRYRDFQLDLVYPSEHFNQYTTSVNPMFPVFKQPTQQTENWNITGLMYRGNKIDIIYNLRAKSVEVRNRRSTDQFVVPDESLEIITYEGSEPMVRQFRVGDTVMISLSTELWVYAPKKQRLQRRTQLTENMHLLASIYSTQVSRRLIRASNDSGKLGGFSWTIIAFIMIINFKFFKSLLY